MVEKFRRMDDPRLRGKGEVYDKGTGRHKADIYAASVAAGEERVIAKRDEDALTKDPSKDMQRPSDS